MGCGEPEFVPNIGEIASSSLVYLTIECPEDNIVHSIESSSGGIIGKGLVITDKPCAEQGIWGVVRTINGVAYEIEAGVHNQWQLTILKVRGLESPWLTIGDYDANVPDKVFIAANPYGEEMAYTIGEHTRKSLFGLGISLSSGWFRADTSRSMARWEGGIVLNYDGELIGIVTNYVAGHLRRAFIAPMAISRWSGHL